MGAVYAAHDPIGRLVALKLVHPQHLNGTNMARFHREGQALAALKSHPNVVGVHALGQCPMGPYLVMDLVQGETLKAHSKRTQPGAERAVELIAGLADGVEHLHQAGVVHRDLKPANVLIREADGAPVITDFGLAQQAGAQRLTLTGEILGTPLYMSPEQLRGQRLDERADVWALGAMLYELLTHRTPFVGDTLLELAQASTSPPPRVRKLAPQIDVTLAGIVEQALGLEPEDRWTSAGAFAASLKAYLRYSEGHGPAPESPKPRGGSMLVPLLVSFVLALVGVGGTAFLLLRTPANSEQADTPRSDPPATPNAKSEGLSELQSRIEHEVLELFAARDWDTARVKIAKGALTPGQLNRLRAAALEGFLEIQPVSLNTLTQQILLLQSCAFAGAAPYPLEVEPLLNWSGYLAFHMGWPEREPALVARVWVGLAIHDLTERLSLTTKDLGPVVDRLEILPELGLPLGDRAGAECAMDTLAGYQGQVDAERRSYKGRVGAALTGMGAYVQGDFLMRVTSEPGWSKGTPGQRLLHWRLAQDQDSVRTDELLKLMRDTTLHPSLRAQAAHEVVDSVDGPDTKTLAREVSEALSWDIESPFLALPYAETIHRTQPVKASELAVQAVDNCEAFHAQTMTLNWSRRSYLGRAAVLFARLGERELSADHLERSNQLNSQSYRENALRCALLLNNTDRAEELVREVVALREEARAGLGERLMARRDLEEAEEQYLEMRLAYREETGRDIPAEWQQPAAD